jgi:hypothetical protein
MTELAASLKHITAVRMMKLKIVNSGLKLTVQYDEQGQTTEQIKVSMKNMITQLFQTREHTIFPQSGIMQILNHHKKQGTI